ncbi:threonylcarbamoyl-AMP synthase [Sulfobacillus acidophilus]|uniref:Threonylcarbamoyl-AMP synthase n=1 Tax=Sulfobacillus acidophilus TaxID=53633 RepID=A0ABS3AVN6_9FIRM|nr:threonylcarbamoyl-AMP synthase [Sulfobacillus acidophilus]
MKSTKTLILNGQLQKDIEVASELLSNDKIVSFCTETVYGLGAWGFSEKAINKIFKAKNRPKCNPLIFHVANIASAKKLFFHENCKNKDVIENRFTLLAHSFWPGPLTIVSFKSNKVPLLATANSAKVAVRIPSHLVAQKLLNTVKKPLVAPSANASNRPSPTCAKHVLATLDGKIDAVLDGGICQRGLESTVVDITQKCPIILRLGAISFEQIKAILPNIKVKNGGKKLKNEHASPGMLKKHYSPEIDSITLLPSSEMLKFWHTKTALLMLNNSAKKLKKELGIRKYKSPIETLPDDPLLYAKELYAAFYRLENHNATKLIIEKPALNLKNTDDWQAILDRLKRASSKNN